MFSQKTVSHANDMSDSAPMKKKSEVVCMKKDYISLFPRNSINNSILCVFLNFNLHENKLI